MSKHAGLASKMVLASIFAQVTEASKTHSIPFAALFWVSAREDFPCSCF
jgi:hypothetical protein